MYCFSQHAKSLSVAWYSYLESVITKAEVTKILKNIKVGVLSFSYAQLAVSN